MCVQIGSIWSIFIVILKYEMLFCYILFQTIFVIFQRFCIGLIFVFLTLLFYDLKLNYEDRGYERDLLVATDWMVEIPCRFDMSNFLLS